MTLKAPFKYEIDVAGHGGQGVVLMSYIISYMGLGMGAHVTWFPSYGAEMRGGTASCTVKISSNPIASPLISNPTHAIVLNNQSFLKFEPYMAPGGTMFINKTLLSSPISRKDIRVYSIDAGTIVERLGSLKITNMVMLGVFIADTKMIKVPEIQAVLANVIPERHHKMIPLNLKAIREGYAAAKSCLEKNN